MTRRVKRARTIRSNGAVLGEGLIGRSVCCSIRRGVGLRYLEYRLYFYCDTLQFTEPLTVMLCGPVLALIEFLDTFSENIVEAIAGCNLVVFIYSI